MAKFLVCGRGGSGKTTVIVLLARRLSKEGRVLIVDTDESNMGLPFLLGMESPPKTVMEVLGGKKEVGTQLRTVIISDGQEKVSFFKKGFSLDALSHNTISQLANITFIRIGKEEHAMEGCACPMGALARDFLNKLDGRQYLSILIDTEAGIEHFGRGLVAEVDGVLYVADPSFEAILLAEKAKRMCEEAKKPIFILANKMGKEVSDNMLRMLKEKGFEPISILQYKKDIAEAHLFGKPISFSTEEIEPVVRSMKNLIKEVTKNERV